VTSLLFAARGRSATIATAESCTGGLVAAALTEVAGASDVYLCGVVSYSNAAKQTMLGVSPDTLERHGAVSEQVAREMADGLRARSGATLAVSVTGIAGPGGSGFKPEGRVCFGLASSKGTLTETIEFGPLGRSKVRVAARDHALGLLTMALKD